MAIGLSAYAVMCIPSFKEVDKFLLLLLNCFNWGNNNGVHQTRQWRQGLVTAGPNYVHFMLRCHPITLYSYCIWLKWSSICLFACLQGQENDIILISLVRSNRKENIGYLADKNRLCVAISRARCGLYLFGNATQFAKAHKKGWEVGWSEICDSLLQSWANTSSL